jgi:hypothetical protein
MKDLTALNFYELFSYSTTRIECRLREGGISTGTGFFIFLNNFKNKDEEPRVALITNKHVIKDSVQGKLILTTKKKGKVDNTKHFQLPHDNFEYAWIPHPDESIDLCMLNFKPYELIFQGRGIELFYFPIPIGIIPDNKTIESLDTLEEVIMIGYPNGIWDSFNNKPIFRKGVTATDFRLNYNNRKEFLIDMAVFGGSSGSPILLTRIAYDEDKKPHREVYLLGILYAGFQHLANGEIKIVEIPQTQKAYIETSIPNNLGIVIKSEKLLDFRRMFYNSKTSA